MATEAIGLILLVHAVVVVDLALTTSTTTFQRLITTHPHLMCLGLVLALC